MPEHKTRALVLELSDFGEIDRIVTFYTSDFGKVKGIAKGAKKSRKRFGAAMDLFSYVFLSFFTRETSGLARINHCQLLQTFPDIQKDIIRIGFGSYVAELIKEMTAEGVSNQELFNTLIKFFSLLDNFPPKEDYLRIFEMRLLVTLGYHPCLNCCVSCKGELKKGEPLWFSGSQGGVVCASCVSGGKNLYPVSPGTLRLLQKATHLDLDKIKRLIFSPQALEESREFLPQFIQYHIGKELKTLKFLEKVRGDNSGGILQ
jgi:DNA repair protein RecO (recombination protein O)